MAQARHKRDTNARRTPRVATLAGSVAVFATGAAVVAGLAVHHHSTDLVAEDATASPTVTSSATPSPSVSSTPQPLGQRAVLSRSLRRDAISAPSALAGRQARATTGREKAEKRWTTTDLNLWTGAGDGATDVALLPAGKVVYWTGRTLQGRDEVLVGGVTRYVTHGYLSAQKPVVPTSTPSTSAATDGLSSEPCPDSSVENGLTDEAVRVYRAVCHAFPQITTYGGWDDHGEHASGKAIDIMTDDETLGYAIADFLKAHAGELDLYDVIYRQHIWTPERASEGWRLMPDRGSATANHYDHVHVSTNG